jgi:PAS domain S-box-containing protein
MKRFLDNLTFKIGVAVILVEIIALTAIGFYYINRFSTEIEQRIETQIRIPGALMSRGLLEFEAVADKEIMGELVGGEFLEGLVIGVDDRAFYSLNPDYAGRKVVDLPEIAFIGQLDEYMAESKTRKVSAGEDSYFVSITPLRLEDKKFIDFLYIRIGTAQLENQKKTITRIFVFGSALCVLVTSIVIIFAFNSMISTRIDNLLSILKRVEEGDLTARVASPFSSDQIGVLQRRVNSMTAQLEETVGTLEQHVIELQQAEEETRRAQIFLNTIVENIPDMIFVKDAAKLRFVLFNRAGEELLGFPREEMIGKNDYDFFPREEADFFTAKDREVLTSGQLLGIPEETIQTKYKGSRILHTKKLPILDEAGKPRFLLGISEDITERVQTEAEREKLITELEVKNAELERFTYTVSHDLKSPLVTINGFLGLLEKDAAKGHMERVKEDIKHISAAVEKMHLLLNDLLELSRIGRLVNPSEEVPLSDLAYEAMALVTGQITRRGVQVDVAPDLPVVFGDRPRLREVLQNLIDNAVKFMGDQLEPRVEIGAEQTGEETICYIRDNGVGIEPRYQDKVFGLFERLDKTTEGTGIGLALVKRIIEVHGGRIWVESKGRGHGSTFWFTLPIHPP